MLIFLSPLNLTFIGFNKSVHTKYYYFCKTKLIIYNYTKPIEIVFTETKW